jgi:anti-anti-sigma regulatory factor
MSFRIDRINGKDLVVFLVSGKLTGEHVDTLRNVLRQESRALAIDLKNVSVVDRDAVQLLALAEHSGTELRNPPKYVREWINRERAVPGEN